MDDEEDNSRYSFISIHSLLLCINAADVDDILLFMRSGSISAQYSVLHPQLPQEAFKNLPTKSLI